MKLFTIPVAPIGANCYVLSDDESKKALIIDPGGDFSKIKATIDKEVLTPEAVLLTHGHFDHIGAAESFVKEGVKCYVKEEDAPIRFIIPPGIPRVRCVLRSAITSSPATHFFRAGTVGSICPAETIKSFCLP